jgi:hypothetical protein
VKGHGNLTLQIPESALIPSGVPIPTTPDTTIDTYRITGAQGTLQGMTGHGVLEFHFFPRAARQTGRGRHGCAHVLAASQVLNRPFQPTWEISRTPWHPNRVGSITVRAEM